MEKYKELIFDSSRAFLPKNIRSQRLYEVIKLIIEDDSLTFYQCNQLLKEATEFLP